MGIDVDVHLQEHVSLLVDFLGVIGEDSRETIVDLLAHGFVLSCLLLLFVFVDSLQRVESFAHMIQRNILDDLVVRDIIPQELLLVLDVFC